MLYFAINFQHDVIKALLMVISTVSRYAKLPNVLHMTLLGHIQLTQNVAH